MPSARLNLAISPSPRHRQLLLGGHAVLLIAIMVLPVNVLAKFALLALLAANAFYTRRLLLQQQDVSHLNLEHNQLSAVYLGQRCDVTKLEPVLVSAWLTIVKLEVKGERYLLPLWRDSADVEQLRRLRVWLLSGEWAG